MKSKSCAALPATVPVFPLPEVLFPHQVLPLHVFEPRYRAMTNDALTHEGFIAVALLRDGYEPDYFTRRAPIHCVCGVGRIIASEHLDDGKFNIVLRGVARARIVAELPHRLYRIARVASLAAAAPSSEFIRRDLRRRLYRAIDQHLDGDARLRAQCLAMWEACENLHVASDLIAGHLPISPQRRQRLLEETLPATRVRLLIDQIVALGGIVRRKQRRAALSEWCLN